MEINKFKDDATTYSNDLFPIHESPEGKLPKSNYDDFPKEQ